MYQLNMSTALHVATSAPLMWLVGKGIKDKETHQFVEQARRDMDANWMKRREYRDGTSSDITTGAANRSSR